MTAFFFQPTTPPGRDAPPQAPTPTTQAPSAPPPAQGPPPDAFGGMNMLFLLLPVLLVLWMTFSQSKKQKQIEASIKVGDRVHTQGGFIVKILELAGNRAKVELAPGVNVWMMKSAIQGSDAGDAKAADDKKKEAAKTASASGDKPQDKGEKPQEKKA